MGKTYCKIYSTSFPKMYRTGCVGIQPCPSSIMKRKREKSKMDLLLKEVMELECGTHVFELLHMAIGVFIIQAMKRR